MVDFDREKSRTRQNDILDRAQSVYQSIKNDVVDYYWERAPKDEEEEIDNFRGMQKYLRSAYEKLDYILRDVDGDL